MVKTIAPRVRDRVSTRLAVVKHLIESKAPLAMPKNVGPQPDGHWVHAYSEHDGLVNYLLFTCFDLLGQHDDWLPFASWLTSAAHAKERAQAVQGMSCREDLIVTAKTIHDFYNLRYGVKTGFMNFIDNVLVPEARQQLLCSVRAVDTKSLEASVSETKKKKLLYRLRNDYTHKAIAYGTARQADGSRLTMGTVSEECSEEKRPAHHLLTEGGVIYFVEDWPFTLFAAVCSAIGEGVPAFDVRYTVLLTLSTGCHAFVSDVSRSHLVDTSTRGKLFASAAALAAKREAMT